MPLPLHQNQVQLLSTPGESQAFASLSLLNIVDGKWRFVDILPSLDENTNGFSQALALMKLPGQ